LINKYADKLVKTGLCDPGEPLIGFLDADLVWNRNDSLQTELRKVFDQISINSLVCAQPAEPYRTMIRYLAKDGIPAIYPKDCETRTFMHDLPVGKKLNTETIVAALKRRKSLIVPDKGIVTYGIVSPEQAFIVYSSVCFAVFVKFFSDYLFAAKHGNLTGEFRDAFKRVLNFVPQKKEYAKVDLMKGPFTENEEVIAAIIQAGRKTVEFDLVDSFFGNISYLLNDTIFISQTSSSLDELGGCIDPCPADGTSCNGITASSELAAHREVLLNTNANSIIHGHPKFSVIMSMDCDLEDECKLVGNCFRRCPEKRFINGTPIVPGEVGTGPFGLSRTMPAALKEYPGAIVYGHGIFVSGEKDFTDAFDTMLAIENGCRETYFERINLLENQTKI